MAGDIEAGETIMTKADSETVLVAETGLGKYQVEARAGDAAFLVDEPISAGGLGSGPNPYSLLSAALGSCTAMTIRLYANRKSWPLKRVQVAVRHSRASLQAIDVFEALTQFEMRRTMSKTGIFKAIEPFEPPAA